MDRRLLDNGYPARGHILRNVGAGTEIVIVRDLPEGIEFRQEGDEFSFEGYGLEWDVVADLGWFTESFRKGAFSDTLDDVRFKVGHDWARAALARSQKTMQTWEDDAGLGFRGTLDLRSPDAMALAVAMEREDIDKASIAFSGITWQKTEADGDEYEKPHYDIIKVRRWWEVSGVDFPAHESSDLQPRDLRAGEERDRINIERTRVYADSLLRQHAIPTE